MSFTETMTQAAAATLYTNCTSIADFQKNPNHNRYMNQMLALAGSSFVDMSGLAAQFDRQHADSIKFEPADFYAFIGQENRDAIKRRKYAIITALSYKEAYRSLKEYAYKQKKDCDFNAIEIGNVKANYNGAEYSISTFVVFHTEFINKVKKYSDYNTVMSLNLDTEKANLKQEITKLLPKLETIYGGLTIPIVKYVVAHLRANNTSSTLFNNFEKPKGLNFLPDPDKKHHFINNKISIYMYFVMKLFAKHGITK